MVGNWVPTGNDAQRMQALLRQALNQLSFAASGLLLLKGVMAQMAPAADFTTVEANFGAPAGSGQTLHDVLGTASDTLQSAPVQALIQRFQ